MLNKVQKEEIVNAYKSSFASTPSFLLINFKGAKVSEFEKLRTKLRNHDTKLSVVKNNLLKQGSHILSMTSAGGRKNWAKKK